ncbi:MAG: polysaccharide deacetylase [Mongoliibacter sp.]|uniref:polysaccharide deacetylase family protein n=1 Tax=Mongoliibacter sp. TaxID=2022438 RepID=UPI0012F4731A|nr:polysaccharide deacetylase family protein [Mongoliibacter sp.]TVP47181.1 MAG: polysaccharide deacetylase [Mongoliibacter sp.]
MINSKVTIVMYHYVRDLKRSRFPGIKGLDVGLFEEQVKYMQRHYTLIRMEDLIESVVSGKTLPERAALLSFDDAYMDHFTNVFPLLYNMGIQGSFYVPAGMVMENKVLNVNKIHFVLAIESDVQKLIRRIFEEVRKIRKDVALPTPETLYEQYAITNGKDTDEVMFVKRMLQKVMPQPFRTDLVNSLFEEAVGMDEATFSRELYMDKTQMQTMVGSGMHLGNHAYSHPWLNTLSKEEQEKEILACNALLDSIGVDMELWTMCFPHGGYNQDTLDILKKHNCKLGLAVNVDIADIKRDNVFTLPRLDTNDLPKVRDAKHNPWLSKA